MKKEHEGVNGQEAVKAREEVLQFFRETDVLDPGRMEQARANGDEKRIKELEGGKAEVNGIITALESGDIGPARDKLLSMIEVNVDMLKKSGAGSPLAEHRETIIGNIKKATGYLEKLESVPSGGEMETEGEKEKNGERSGSEGAEEEDLSSSLERLKNSENSLKEVLEEIKRARQSQEEKLRKMKMERITKEIHG